MPSLLNSSIQSAKTGQGTDYGSDHLTAKFRLELKKVWKTTRPFRYDLNQTPYNYTVEVTNRFKGLDSIESECWKNYGWKFVTFIEGSDQDYSQEKEMQKRQNDCLEEAYKELRKEKKLKAKKKRKDIPV